MHKHFYRDQEARKKIIKKKKRAKNSAMEEEVETTTVESEFIASPRTYDFEGKPISIKRADPETFPKN